MNSGSLARRQQSWLRAFPAFHSSGASFVRYRMDALLQMLGNPERELPARIQIVGTNGKGSTTTTMQAILEAAGYRVGAFLSPAFVSETEKIRSGSHFLSEDMFEEQIRLLGPVAARLKDETGEEPTRFELITALAVLLFREWRVDVALFEAGLGGRHDSTTALRCPLVALTNVSLDHMQILGETIHAIAWDKIHAVQKGTRAAVTTAEGEARALLEERCCTFGVPLAEPRLAFCEDLSFDGTICKIVTPQHTYDTLKTNLIGLHQVRNVALAVTTAEEAARLFSLSVSEGDVRRGCAAVVHPGRFQLTDAAAFGPETPMPPRVILDGAHNAAGLKAVMATLLALSPERSPLAVYAAKNLLSEALAALVERSERTYLPTVDLAPHFQRPDRLVRLLPSLLKKRVTVCKTVEEAAKKALTQGKTEQRPVLFTGSLYFLGALYATYPDLMPPAYAETPLPTLSSVPSV